MPSRENNLTISLPAELEQFINDQVSSGNYPNASEIVRDALRLLRLQADCDPQALENLKQKLRRGAAQAERGDLVDGQQFFEQLLARLVGESARGPSSSAA